MIVSDVMTRNVLSVTPDTGVSQVAGLLLEHRISGLLVIDAEGALAGIVTEGDLLRRGELGAGRERSWWQQVLASPARQAADFTRTHGGKVSDVMTAKVISVEHDADLSSVVDLMEQHRIRRLPVLQSSRIVGVVSRADLLKAILAHGERTGPEAGDTAGADDEAIRAAIVAELERQPWAPTVTLRVGVAAGVVALEGTVMGDDERRGVCVIAENTKGVREVQDRLTIVEPYSGTVIEAPDSVP